MNQSPSIAVRPELSARDWLSRRLDAHPGRLRRDGHSSVVNAHTIIGDLWMHGDDQLMTPIVVQHGFWEPELGALMQKTVTPGMNVVDVGANIGYFSVMAAGLTGPTGHVHSIEPEPGNLALLTANLWRNGHRNATIVPRAVYSYTGDIRFIVPDISRAACRVDPTGTAEDGFTLSCVSLDDLLEGRTIDYLKVDAEGADLEVLRGGRTVLGNSPDPVVIVEVWTEYTPEKQFQDFMDEGFDLHLISDAGDLSRASMDEALSAASLVTYMNIVLRRPA